jgi:hypothetical protein
MQTLKSEPNIDAAAPPSPHFNAPPPLPNPRSAASLAAPQPFVALRIPDAAAAPATKAPRSLSPRAAALA